MINHGKVRSTIKPEKMVIDEYSVWISENINKIEVESENSDSNEKTVMYEYDLIQYTKDEYIAELNALGRECNVCNQTK